MKFALINLFFVVFLTGQIIKTEASQNNLGHRHRGRMAGGTEAEPGQFPYMVSISKYTSEGSSGDDDEMWHLFGGALITSVYVITSATAIKEPDAVRFEVGVGSLNYSNSDDNNMEVSGVDSSKTRTHPYFDPKTLLHNIGLLGLLQGFPGYIPLVPRTSLTLPLDNIGVRISGWGVYTFNSNLPKYKTNLQFMDMIIQPYEDCYRSLGYFHSPTILCGKPLNDDVNALVGDAGGPAVRFNFKGEKELLGIISQPGNASRVPTQIIRLDYYFDWIHRETGIVIREEE